MTDLDYILPIGLGISLAAAAGFRIFIPLLFMGLAARYGYLPIGDTFAWVATTPAVLMLAVAALAEVAAYYIPGLDNLLDGLAAPAAIAAGIGMSAAVMTDMQPMLKWTLAIIAGGGAAAMTQAATTAARAGSSAMTAGLGNNVVASGELLTAVILPLIAFAWPMLALIITLALLAMVAAFIVRFKRRRRRPDSASP